MVRKRAADRRLPARGGVDELKGNYAADARVFAPYIRHILNLADMISGGIIKQFPNRFS